MLISQLFQAVDLTKIHVAFVIKNLKTGESVSHHENEVVKSASLIKIPIMAEVFRRVKDGKLTLQRRIAVTEADKVDGSILSMLETGNQYSIKDLLTLMIVQSDNTAANLLIDNLGLDEINELIRCLDLKNTMLRRKMMDFQAGSAGRENVTTAGDMARLLELLYQGAVIDKTASADMLEIMKQQRDRSMMRLFIPDETVIAHKTGELDGLAHDAGIVFHPSGDYILVVFTWGALHNMVARQSIGLIARAAYDYFTEKY